MSNIIMRELWQVKDEIAKEHEYNIGAYVAHLKSKERIEGHQIVDLQAHRKPVEQSAPADTNNDHH